MSTTRKKVETKFNFDSTTPRVGGTNYYRNLAPGASLSEAVRLRHAIRAEKFTEYERVMAELAAVIGEIDFSRMPVSEEQYTLGAAIDDILNRLESTNDRISSGGFPLREMYRPLIFRSYGNQHETSQAIMTHDPILPGELTFEPEFEIIKIDDRKITLLGGKSITGQTVISYTDRPYYYNVEIDPPDLLKNVEFDDTTATYPKSIINRVLLNYNGSTGRFEGTIPVRRSENKIPYNLPVEPGTIEASGSDMVDILVLWDDAGTDRLLMETSADPSNRDIKVVYPSGNSAGIYLSILPTTFLNANEDPGASDTGNILTVYAYYYYPAWRYDSLIADTDGNLVILKGSPLSLVEQDELSDKNELYRILVSCWDDDPASIQTSNEWKIRSEIAPIYTKGKTTGADEYTQGAIQKISGLFPKNLTIPVDWKNNSTKYRSPIDSAFATARGKYITKYHLYGDYGVAPEIRNTGNPGAVSIPIVNDAYDDGNWTELNYIGDLNDEDAIYDLSKPFYFNGINFQLYRKPPLGSEAVALELEGDGRIEYQVFDGDSMILHAKTMYPHSAAPYELIYQHADPIKSSSLAGMSVKCRITGMSDPNEEFYIYNNSGSNNEVGDAMIPWLFHGNTLTACPSQVNVVSITGPSAGWAPLNNEEPTFTNITPLHCPSEFYYPFHNGDEPTGHSVISVVSLYHNYLDTDGSGNKYIRFTISRATDDHPDYKSVSIMDVSLNSFGELNSPTNQSNIIDVVFSESGGMIHFAALVQYYTASVPSEEYEKETIMVGTILPGMANFVHNVKFVGNTSDYPNSPYGHTRFIKRLDEFAGIRGRQLDIDADEEGNTVVGFLGKKRNEDVDVIDVICMDRAKNMRGEYRAENSNQAEWRELKVKCLTSYMGFYSAAYMVKTIVQSPGFENVYAYSIRVTRATNLNENDVTEMEEIANTQFDGTVYNDGGDMDEKAFILDWYAEGPYMRVMLSRLPNVFPLVNWVVCYDLHLSKSQWGDSYNLDIIAERKHYLNSEAGVDRSTPATIRGRCSLTQYVYCTEQSGNFHVVKYNNEGYIGETTYGEYRDYTVNVRYDSVMVAMGSDNYITTPEVTFLLTGYANGPHGATSTLSYDKDGIPSLNGGTDYWEDSFYIGHVISEGEELIDDTPPDINIIADPYAVGASWTLVTVTGMPPVESPVVLSDNYDDILILTGSRLEYTLPSGLAEATYSDMTNGIMAVAYHTYESTGSYPQFNDMIDVKVEGETKTYDLIHRDNGIAWFYIDWTDIGNSLTITFTNRLSASVKLAWATACKGWRPVLLGEHRETERILIDDVHAYRTLVAGTSISAGTSLSVGTDASVGDSADVGIDVVIAGEPVLAKTRRRATIDQMIGDVASGVYNDSYGNGYQAVYFPAVGSPKASFTYTVRAIHNIHDSDISIRLKYGMSSADTDPVKFTVNVYKDDVALYSGWTESITTPADTSMSSFTLTNVIAKDDVDDGDILLVEFTRDTASPNHAGDIGIISIEVI